MTRTMDQAQLDSLGTRKVETLRGRKAPVADGPFPLSCAQESLWFVEQMSPGTPTYNIPEAWRMKGRVDPCALERSLDEIVRRHEVLRTMFLAENGKPAQWVLDTSRLELEQIDLSGNEHPEDELRLQLDRAARQVFELCRAPLARAVLYRLAPEEHVLLLNVHHIISDAWSQGLLMRELARWYASFVTGEPCSLVPLPIQYPDFALWQAEMVESEVGCRHMAYWKEQLRDIPAPTSLPPDKGLRAAGSGRGQTQFIDLPKRLVDSLKDLARQHGVTLYITLLAGFNVLLQRYSREQEVIVGSPMACRDRLEVEGLLGLFVNTHALRTDLSGDPTFVELLQRVREAVLQAYAHQEFPSELLLKHLTVKRSTGRHPLFQVVFGWQNTPPLERAMPGLELTRIELETGTAKFDWTVLVAETPNGLHLRSEFSTDLFEPSTMSRLPHQFEVLLEEIAACPAAKISELPLLRHPERDELLKEWSHAASTYERESRIQDVFEAMAVRFPERTAMLFDGGKWTYEELNLRANRLAHLLADSGVKPSAAVAICLERSPETICAILATLKAGAVYVPLNPEYPAERLAFMIRDAGASVVVTHSKHLPKLQSLGVATFIISLDQKQARLAGACPKNPVVQGSPTNPAYVMYTSGSTGTPKGAVVPHRAVIRLVRRTNYLEFSPDLVFLHAAPLTFDASTFEIWGALLNGAKLVIAPAGMISLEQLGRTIRSNGITTLWLTSGLFDQMVDQQIESLRGLKHLLTGGDVLSPAHVAKALEGLPGCHIINGYGPTENTTFTTCFRVPACWAGNQPVPIGRPISNTSVYVLDERLAPVPVGMPGELYAGGDGLALGYLGESCSTNGKFIPNPFSSDKANRLYRTGDLVRWRADGNLEFLGRIDSQTKVRGHRIEPGEVESALCEHPKIRAAVVVVHDDQFVGKQLVAHVAGSRAEMPTPAALREFLAAKLPAYMLPAHILAHDSLPLTSNGKVDRRALPNPNFADASNDADATAPRTATETIVARTWCDLLGRSRVGIHEDFFLLGGHSLIATQVISRLTQVWNVELPLRAIFEEPTVARLAAAIDRSQGQGSGSPSPIARRGASRAAELLERLDEFTEAEIEALLQDPELKTVL